MHKYLNNFISNDITPEEFEKWLKANNWLLENNLGEDIYNSLLNRDFTSNDDLNSLKEQVQHILDPPSYEHERIIHLIEELITHEEAYIQCCREIYEEYCNGYRFFKNIALTSICFDFDHRLEKPDNLDGMYNVRQSIVQEATTLLEHLKSAEIKIVEEYYYFDNR